MSVNAKVFEKIAQVEKLLEEIKGDLAVTEFRTPSPNVSVVDTYKPDSYTTSADLPPVESMAPTKSELQKDGIDFDEVDFLTYGTLIKGKGFLDKELWNTYDKILYAAGYKYSKEDKGWKFQPRDSKQERSQPQKAAPTKDGATKVTRVSDLRTGMKSPTIEGQLLEDPIQRDVNTARGPATVTSFRLDDGTGEVRVSLWGDLANSAMSLVSGDRVQVTSLMVKDPYDGVPQVSGGKWSKVTKL